MRELVPRIEAEVLDLGITIDQEEVKDALSRNFGEMTDELEVNFTMKAFRGSLKAFVELSEDVATKLLRSGHIKVGWLSCRIRKKTEAEVAYILVRSKK